MANQTECHVAFVGAGRMGREHIRAFSDVPGVALAGLHSRTRSRAEALAREHGVPIVCESISELYDTTRADLVVVAVPETEVNAVSRACVEFPWTVLLEKPPGLNVPDAEDIAAAARARKRSVLVALNRRFLSSTQAALADVSAQTGTRFMVVQDQEDQQQARALGHPEVVVEHWMYANSIHVIDYFLLFGRGEVTAVTPIYVWDPQRPGIVVATIEFTSGDIGLYEAIWNGPGPWAVSISAPERRWELRPLERAAVQSAGQRRLETMALHPWDEAFKPGFRLQAQMAVAAARGEPSSVPTLDEALRTMRLIQAIYTRPSAASHRDVNREGAGAAASAART